MDDSDDELPVPLAHRSFLQNIYEAFVVAIQRRAAAYPESMHGRDNHAAR